jgi:hypothetical protein
MTVKGIDNERRFAIVQCDTCRTIASMNLEFVSEPD